MAGILQVLPLRECKNYILKCHKKKRMLRGKRKDFPRMQNVKWKPRRKMLNAGRPIVTVRWEKQLFETQEESAKRKKTMWECLTKQQQTERQNETEEQGAKRKKTDCDCKTKHRHTETEEQGVKRKKTKQDCMRKKREEMRHWFLKDGRDCTEEDMTNVINCATKEAKQFLHRTWDPPAAERMRKLRLKMSKEKRMLRG